MRASECNWKVTWGRLGTMAEKNPKIDPTHAVLLLLINRGGGGLEPRDGPAHGLSPTETGKALLVLIARGWARLCPDWKCRPTGEGKLMAAAGTLDLAQ